MPDQIRTVGRFSGMYPAGRFSKDYPPERQCIRLDSWPEPDRRAYERARKTGDPFELPGPAALWAPATCRGRLQAYGRYLNFLKRKGLLLECEGPADRMTPDRLAEYLAEASRLLSARTTKQALMELRRVLRAMVPEADWRWITRHPGQPSRAAIRASGRPKKTFDLRVMCCKALDLMDHISAGPLSLELRILYRNALIVAIQCVFALRRDNIIHMALGRSLIIGDEVIHVVFRSSETKNYAPMSGLMPEWLKPYLFTYLREHRPMLLNGKTSDAVWINGHHNALEYGASTFIFESMGIRLLGYPINCHSFRHSAATTILTRDPRNIRMAAGVLSHRSLRTTNQHYDLSGDTGSRRIWDKMRRDIQRGKGINRP